MVTTRSITRTGLTSSTNMAGTAPTAATLTQFVNNPYQANFNPSDKVGAQLYIEATKPFADDKRIEVSQKNVTKLMNQLNGDARKFFWSPLINLVDTNDAGTAKKQILEDFETLSLEDVKKQANRIWNDPAALHSDPLPATFAISNLTIVPKDLITELRGSTFNRRLLKMLCIFPSLVRIFYKRQKS